MRATYISTSAGLAILLGAALFTVSAAAAPRVDLLRTPDGGIQPQTVMDAQGNLHLVYLKGDPRACDVWYVRRDVNRTNFSAPRRVNSQAGTAVAIGTIRGAQLALGRNGRVHVAWNGSQPVKGSDSPMLYSRMNDNADGFDPQRDLMTSTTHLDGGGSVAADADGNVFVVWHGHKKSGPQTEQDRAVFAAMSKDDGKTFTPERQVSPQGTGACSCCGLKAYADNHGRLSILYRSASASGNRDTTLLVSENHGASFEPTTLGPWRLRMCPMSSMALGAGLDDDLMAMWETAGEVNYTEPLDKKSSLAKPEGNGHDRKHPAFAAGKGPNRLLLLAWTEGTAWAKGGSLAWECVDSGQKRISSGRADGVPAWSKIAAVPERDGSFTIIY